MGSLKGFGYVIGLVGFTAWSSTREPPDVFRLLETIYSSFDKIAERRRIFKVETVGDCCKYLETKTRWCIMDASLMLVSHSGLL